MVAERWLIVGCGYVGSQVAKLARQSGQVVYALTRSESRFDDLLAAGVRPCLGHWLKSDTLHDLPSVDRVLIAVPHRADQAAVEVVAQTMSKPTSLTGDAASEKAPAESASEPHDDFTAEQTHAVGLQNLCAALPAGWQKLIYLSTTGVYGHSSAEWIDETTPVSPLRTGPRIAVAAERWLAQAGSQPGTLGQVEHCILRLAGIYGPGRIPLAERLRRGEPLAVSRQGHLNLVHVTDIAHLLCWLLTHDMRHSMYLLSDGQPVLRETFYRYLAELCGVAQPEFVEPDAQSAKALRANDKRISPARLLAESGYQLQFPDYRSGLVDALAGTVEL